MANFWENLKTSVGDVADKAAKKAGELSDLAKTKMALHNEEARLGEIYKQIGTLYYAYQRMGDDNTSVIASLIVEADACRETIRTLTDAIADSQKK